MMHEFPCHVVRARLEAFHDGEVPFSERITIQGHLEDCVSCSLANEELNELTASLQQMVAETEDVERAVAPVGARDRAAQRRRAVFADVAGDAACSRTCTWCGPASAPRWRR